MKPTMFKSVLLAIIDSCIEPFIMTTKKNVAQKVRQEQAVTVLDICSLTGEQARWLSREYLDVVGVDISLPSLNLAKKKYPSLKLVCCDMNKLPFVNGSFDAVTSTNALHDKMPQIRIGALREITRVLRDDGVAVFTDLCRVSYVKSKLWGLKTFVAELFSGHFSTGIQFIKNGGIHDAVLQGGFGIVEEHYFEKRNVATLITRHAVQVHCPSE